MTKPKFTDTQKYPNGYRASHETDIRRTFARVLRERAEAKLQDEANAKEAAEKRIAMPARKRA